MRKRPSLRADDKRRKKRTLDKIEHSETGEGESLANLYSDRRKNKSGEGKRLV